MLPARQYLAFLVILASTLFLSNCASTSNSNSSNGGKSPGTSSGNGLSNSGSGSSGSGSSSSGSGSSSSGGSGSGSGSSGAGAGSGQSVPGFGVGTGASGQNSAAKFLFASPLPAGGPYAATIQTNGILKLAQPGSANNLNPMTMAIDPTGSFLFQTSQETYQNTPAGIFVYKIDRATGSPGPSVDSYTAANVPFYDDVVDQQGKFLYAYGGQAVYAFTIDASTGTLTPVAGSPFPAATPSSPGYTQAATLMAVDQTNKFLYVSTGKGIYAYTIDPSTGTITLIAGSPFAATVTSSWAIAITPTNSYLYQLQSSTSASINAYSVDRTSGALTPVSGSPFRAGTCGTMVPVGTIGIPGPDNMTIARAGKFMYDNCGIYSIDESTGAITQVSNQGPGDWPVIDPTGDFLWAITGDQAACFHCDEGVTTYSVNATTGALTAVPNSFLFLTNSEVGAVNSLAITR